MKSETHFSTVVLLAFLIAIAGCDKKPAAQSAKDALKIKPVATALKPNETEARDCCEAFENAVATADKNKINTLLDWDALLERAIGDIPCRPNVRQGFVNGVKQGADRGFADELCAATEAGGSYKLLRLHQSGSEQRALFRLLLPAKGGVNYHDVILAKDRKNRTRIVDVYVFLSSETMSTTLRRGFLPIAAQTEKSILQRLTTKESDFVKNIGRLSEMVEARQQNDYRKILAIYNGLPDSMQRDKLCLLLRLFAASNLDEKTHEEAIDAFRAAYPDDPSIDLMSLDSFFFKKDYKGGIQCLERLQKAIGGDAYLTVLTANLRLEMGEPAAAMELCREAIATEPNLKDAYWTLVTSALKAEDWDTVSATLISLEENFDLKFKDLTKSEIYKPFTETEQYRQWQQRHARPESTSNL